MSSCCTHFGKVSSVQTTVAPCGVVAGEYGERGNTAQSSLGSQDKWRGCSDPWEGEEQPKETYSICQGGDRAQISRGERWVPKKRLLEVGHGEWLTVQPIWCSGLFSTPMPRTSFCQPCPDLDVSLIQCPGSSLVSSCKNSICLA